MIIFSLLQGGTAQHAHNPIAREPQLGHECLTHTFRKFRFSITSLELISCRFGHYLHIPICGSPTRAKISLLHSLTYSNRPYDILRHRLPPIFTKLPQPTGRKYMQKNEGPKITLLISEIFTLLQTPTGTPMHHSTQGSDENTGKYFILPAYRKNKSSIAILEQGSETCGSQHRERAIKPPSKQRRKGTEVFTPIFKNCPGQTHREYIQRSYGLRKTSAHHSLLQIPTGILTSKN